MGRELAEIGAADNCGIARVESKGMFVVPTLYSFESSPIYYLLIGTVSFVIALASVFAGKTWGRFEGVIYRDKEPRKFWGLVIVYFLIGLCFVGYTLYLVT